MKKYIVTLIGCLLFLCSCNKETDTEKYPDFTKKLVDVSDKIVPIKTNQFFGRCRITTAGKYLLLTDLTSLDKGFLLFDKKTFQYVISTGSKGQGPGQIINYENAKIIPNTVNNESFYVFDYSKLMLYEYALDSILNNKKYLPKEVLSMNLHRVIGDVAPLNDSIFLGISSKAINSHSFTDELVRFNIKNGEIKQLRATHSKSKTAIKKTHATFALSANKQKYVHAYRYIDLMELYGINGNLLCSIYGNLWKKRDKKNLGFYQQVEFGENYIMAAYVGSKVFKIGADNRMRAVFASRIVVFDTEGNHLKTLNIGEEIRGFCIDEENNRIIINYLDRDEPLAYLDLKGILI